MVLAVAGGILAEAGGRLTEDFVGLIKEDHGEVLREVHLPGFAFILRMKVPS